MHASIKLGFSRLHSQASYERSKPNLINTHHTVSILWLPIRLIPSRYYTCFFLATFLDGFDIKHVCPLCVYHWNGCLADTLDWEISISKVQQIIMSQLAVKDVPSHQISFGNDHFKN